MVDGVPRRSWSQMLLSCLLVGALGVATVGAGSLVADPALAAHQQSKTCQQISTSVEVNGVSGDLTIVGDLCWRNSIAGKPLYILTSGFTYDRSYWDFPFKPHIYSYVDTATWSYVTFHYDRLGVGDSDLPGGLPGTMTIANHAHVLHQLVQDARSGDLSGTAFSTVVSVGHSMGSTIALYEAGVYGDVDALLLTGNMRETQPDFVTVPLHPAQDDPKFAGTGLPPEVLTTVPGVRDSYLHTHNIEPGVVSADENLKATGLVNELITIPTAYQPQIAGGVDVPVLFVQGQDDFLYCNTAKGFPCDAPQDILSRQAPMLPNAPCVDAVIIGGAGHALNLHLSAPSVFAVVNTHHWQSCT